MTFSLSPIPLTHWTKLSSLPLFPTQPPLLYFFEVSLVSLIFSLFLPSNFITFFIFFRWSHGKFSHLLFISPLLTLSLFLFYFSLKPNGPSPPTKFQFSAPSLLISSHLLVSWSQVQPPQDWACRGWKDSHPCDLFVYCIPTSWLDFSFWVFEILDSFDYGNQSKILCKHLLHIWGKILKKPYCLLWCGTVSTCVLDCSKN